MSSTSMLSGATIADRLYCRDWTPYVLLLPECPTSIHCDTDSHRSNSIQLGDDAVTAPDSSKACHLSCVKQKLKRAIDTARTLGDTQSLIDILSEMRTFLGSKRLLVQAICSPPTDTALDADPSCKQCSDSLFFNNTESDPFYARLNKLTLKMEYLHMSEDCVRQEIEGDPDKNPESTGMDPQEVPRDTTRLTFEPVKIMPTLREIDTCEVKNEAMPDTEGGRWALLTELEAFLT